LKYKNNINGIIQVNKPKGLTSRDVVNEVQRLLNTKAGHTGTLDPMAEGVLVICLGKATKLTDILTSTEKEYIAEMRCHTIGTLQCAAPELKTMLLNKLFQQLFQLLGNRIRQKFHKAVPAASRQSVYIPTYDFHRKRPPSMETKPNVPTAL